MATVRKQRSGFMTHNREHKTRRAKEGPAKDTNAWVTFSGTRSIDRRQIKHESTDINYDRGYKQRPKIPVLRSRYT